jgi:hypothetical protein
MTFHHNCVRCEDSVILSWKKLSACLQLGTTIIVFQLFNGFVLLV